MAKVQYTITCDACNYSDTASTEDLANMKAMTHVGSAHKDSNQAHMLGQHIHVTPPTVPQAE